MILQKMTQDDWSNAKNEKQMVSVIGDKFVVFCGIGDLLVFWTGSSEYDEIILSDTLNSFINILKQICKKGVNETSIVEQYSKICLCLDEMVNKGILDQVDPFFIKNYVDMKPEEVKKK